MSLEPTYFVKRLISLWTATLFFLWSPIFLVSLDILLTQYELSACVRNYRLVPDVNHQNFASGFNQGMGKGGSDGASSNDEDFHLNHFIFLGGDFHHGNYWIELKYDSRSELEASNVCSIIDFAFRKTSWSATWVFIANFHCTNYEHNAVLEIICQRFQTTFQRS